MLGCVLAALAGAQAVGLPDPSATRVRRDLIIDESKSELLADSGGRLRSEDAMEKLTGIFVSSFLSEDHLTLTTPHLFVAPPVAVPISAAAAAAATHGVHASFAGLTVSRQTNR